MSAESWRPTGMLMWRRGLLRRRRDTFSTSSSICVAGVALSTCVRKLGDERVLMWRRGLLRGKCDAFSASSSICVEGVAF